MNIVLSVLYFSKEKNHLITGKRKLEEQCKSAQKLILKPAASHDALLSANGSLNNELILTMQNIDATQATTAHLRSDKKQLTKITENI